MRPLLTLALVLPIFPTATLADDFATAAPVTTATLYPQAVVQTHTIKLDLPAGTHRILFPAMLNELGFHGDTGLPNIKLVSGEARIGALSTHANSLQDRDLFFTKAQIKARDKFHAARDATDAHGATIKALRDQINALVVQQKFINDITPPEGGASVDDLNAMLALIGTQSNEIQTKITDLKAEIERQKEAGDTLSKALERAKSAYLNIALPENSPVFSLPISVETPQTIELAIPTMRYGGWAPKYDIRLTEGEQDTLTIDRSATLRIPANTVWENVSVVLSTAMPSAQNAPTPIYPNQATIYQAQVQPRTLKAASAPMTMDFALSEPEMMAEVSNGVAVDFGSVAVSYRPKNAVSAVGGDTATLDLGQLSYDVETEIHANPRVDSTAFLMANLVNTGDEPLLGGGASLYRDGTLVGATTLEYIPAGGDASLSFGALNDIRLEHIIAQNETGDRGILTTSNTREQNTVFRITNLGTQTKTIKAFYPFAYSEQEDLHVEVASTPRPDTTDHDDKRGVSVWDVALAPGETQEVSVSVKMSWPDGQMLNWHP